MQHHTKKSHDIHSNHFIIPVTDPYTKSITLSRYSDVHETLAINSDRMANRLSIVGHHTCVISSICCRYVGDDKDDGVSSHFV